MGCSSTKCSRVASSGSQGAADFEQALSEAAPSEFHRDYLLHERLGAGAFGAVYSSRRMSDGKSVAVKIVDPRAQGDGRRGQFDKALLRMVEAEANILRALPQSNHVIRVHDVRVCEGLVYLVMERCCMSLLPFLDRMPAMTEASLRPVFEEMLSGIAVCHAAGIAHRDVKCDNFLLGPRRSGEGVAVKLCDFGCASAVPSADARTLAGVCGTAPYMAPEMLGGERYTAKVDVWALGVLAHVVLFGCWPYMPSPMSTSAMKASIRLGAPAPSFQSRAGLPCISPECTAWVQALLSRDPAQRPSAQGALGAASFRYWDATQPLGRALRDAVRCGAFERPGPAPGPKGELEVELRRINAKFHGVSEASTDASGRL